MYFKKVLISTALILFIGLKVIQGQEAIPASGGNLSGTEGSVSYSVGQVLISSSMSEIGSVTPGVQQPYEISVITGIDQAQGITLSCSAYPNPVTDFIILKINDFHLAGLTYQLFGVSGRLLENKIIQSSETKISMEVLLPATYFLKVYQEGMVLKTFKIIKK